MRKEYDYLIVGSGLFGAVFACEAGKRGKRCLVIDKRDHQGGNIYSRSIEGINVHWYGAHIFHTNSQEIWDYVNGLVPFRPFVHSPRAFFRGKYYSLPFNMNTFRELWGVETEGQAREIINEQVREAAISHPKNLKEQTIALVGSDIFEKLVKGYSEKQWGKKAEELPAFLIKRLPLRFTFDNNYYNDKFQGLPQGGYNNLSAALLNKIEVRLNTDYFGDRDRFNDLADKMIFTGSMDQFYDHKFGRLEYRSLKFEHRIFDQPIYQEAAVINYTDAEVPQTRTIEHKWLDQTSSKKTVVTWEYPESFNGKNEPFYPVNDERNMKIFKAYHALAQEENKVIFGGRLAEFRYYDMHQVIAAALTRVKQEFG
jgi:UDP-galactopyranose mutase